MTLTLVTLGSRGDLDPFVALGRALVVAGHRVRLVTQAEFADRLTGTGLEPWLVRMDPARDLLDRPEARAVIRRGTDVRAAARLLTAMTPQFERVYRVTLAAARGSRAVLCHPMTFPALDVAAHLGLPVVQIHHVLAVPTRALPSATAHRLRHDLGPWGNRFSHSAEEWLAWLLSGRIMNRLGGKVLGRGPLSARQARELRRRRVGAVVGVSPQVLPRPDDWPPEVVLPGYLRTPRAESPPLDPATLRFLAAGDPPLLVTLGSTPVPDPAKVTRVLAAATRDLGLRMILQRGVAGLGAGCEPDRVHLVDTLPYERVLARVAGVVHHAGSGTLAEVLTHGRPSLALPGFADQYLWAHRIPAIGAGPAPLPLPRLGRATLTRRLRELTGEPRYRLRAAEIAAGLRGEDGPAAAATAIDRFLPGR